MEPPNCRRGGVSADQDLVRPAEPERLAGLLVEQVEIERVVGQPPGLVLDRLAFGAQFSALRQVSRFSCAST